MKCAAETSGSSVHTVGSEELLSFLSYFCNGLKTFTGNAWILWNQLNSSRHRVTCVRMGCPSHCKKDKRLSQLQCPVVLRKHVLLLCLQDGRDFGMAETSFPVEEGSNVVSVCGAEGSECVWDLPVSVPTSPERTNAFDRYLVRLLVVVWWLFLRILTHAGHHDWSTLLWLTVPDSWVRVDHFFWGQTVGWVRLASSVNVCVHGLH